MPYTEDQKAALSKKRGQAASYIQDSDARQKYISAQGDLEAKGKVKDSDYDHLDHQADNTIALQGADIANNIKGYKNGTDRVPATGPAILHKGEAVLKKEDADKYRSAKGNIFSAAGDAMGGHTKHPKKIKEIRTRKGANGGYIHEHHHTHPDQHPMEEHVSPDQDAMASHMMDHMGESNPGEAEADAGQSGTPDAGGAAAGGAAAAMGM